MLSSLLESYHCQGNTLCTEVDVHAENLLRYSRFGVRPGASEDEHIEASLSWHALFILVGLGAGGCSRAKPVEMGNRWKDSGRTKKLVESVTMAPLEDGTGS